MMETFLSVLGQTLLVLGALVCAHAALGLIRFPDMYMRSSAIATASGMGLSILMTGVFLLVPGWDTLLKLLVAIPLQLVTSAIGSMTLGRAAYMVGSPLYSPGRHNALASSEGGQAGPQPSEPVDPGSSAR